MQIPCSETHCVYCQFGECTLKSAADHCSMDQKCHYFQLTNEKEL